MSEEKPLVNANYLLKKFPGKGGWTYAEIPETRQNKENPFGWVKVKGKIDDYELNHYKLMPMGNKKLFLPVKAEIRKKIKKKEGDIVHIILYSDETPLGIPAEIMECFKNESKEAWENFQAFSDSEQKAYLDWIYNAKTDETKAKRIIQMMDKVQQGLKFYD
ncbi:YdeI/OmpD-associated family protein [Limibacter armeniacum]|uniref:YdeI/OmpD-associated family protein n=1 Tax=Limibacter armeniacum TaxID=466084 RepID=UPI002FE630FE